MTLALGTYNIGLFHTAPFTGQYGNGEDGFSVDDYGQAGVREKKYYAKRLLWKEWPHSFLRARSLSQVFKKGCFSCCM
jgi:hypothetical protein